MKNILLLCLVLSFSAHARGGMSSGHAYTGMPSSTVRTQRAPNFEFAPMRRKRPNDRGSVHLHEIPLSTEKRLHREGLDNTTAVFI